MSSEELLEINISTKDDNTLEISSNNFNLILDESMSIVVDDNQDETKSEVVIDEENFNDVIELGKYQTEIWEVKNIWEIDIPDKDLQNYLFEYFQKKSNKRKNQNIRVIQSIKRKTQLFYNLINQLQN